jgi:glycosyltransferase involved in cell wall biosynthesis
MKVSKHHYALELAERNCRVFFIEPPDLSLKGISVSPCTDHPLISIVRYKPVFRGKRFLPQAVYRFLLKRQVKLLVSKISQKPDVVWCFHGYLFENLKWFGAPVNIYFAADQFFYDEVPPEIGSSLLTLAVSDTIYQRIKKRYDNVIQINHGLQSQFVKSAEEFLSGGLPLKSNAGLVAGYTGNLRMQALDRLVMMQVVKDNPDVKFIFWGSFKKSELNLGGMQDQGADEFIDFLEKSPNVELRGVVNSAELQKQMKEADLFWLCWKLGVDVLWDGSNSHKILEYLSTGKPVISHHVSSYKGTDYLNMMPSMENRDFPVFFKSILHTIRSGERIEVIQNRLQFAVDNSYSRQVERIEKMIANSEK